MDQGIDIFIQELKLSENDEPLNNERQEVVPSSQSGNSYDIHTRAYVIALNIYYQIHKKEDDYYPLTHSPAEYEEMINFLFRAKNLSTSLYKVIQFDYKKELNNPNKKSRGTLKRQFEQVINNPEVFNKEVIKRAKEIYDKHFTKER